MVPCFLRRPSRKSNKAKTYPGGSSNNSSIHCPRNSPQLWGAKLTSCF
jgi:hypothetical protein